jgi:hypothetical protein
VGCNTVTVGSMTTKTATSLLPKIFSIPLFLVGPIATLMALHTAGAAHALMSVGVGPACFAALACWSPLPIALPALVMQDVRDSYGASMRGVGGTLKRGVLISFWLTSKNSPVRAEMTASLVGFLVALIWMVH